jgi:hypothetical protein
MNVALAVRPVAAGCELNRGSVWYQPPGLALDSLDPVFTEIYRQVVPQGTERDQDSVSRSEQCTQHRPFGASTNFVCIHLTDSISIPG